MNGQDRQGEGGGFQALLFRICDDGAEAARADYAAPRNADKLEGALQGFADARAATSPAALLALLTEANADMIAAHRRQDTRYWVFRCRQAEIEWACNVISAALYASGREPIIPPTARGLMKAANILGIANPTESPSP